jgi:hypothetical protein
MAVKCLVANLPVPLAVQQVNDFHNALNGILDLHEISLRRVPYNRQDAEYDSPRR